VSKNIILCADGTWNGPSEPDHDDKTSPPTNVFKLFSNLDGIDTPGTSLLANEQERWLRGTDGSAQQVAKYLNGVGDSDNFLVKALGGTVGVGLITRIVRGYTFISRNYVAGDKVFVLGFSRGAYTARALAGLIGAKGLLDAKQLDLDDKVSAYRLGTAVWLAYRQSALAGRADLLSHLAGITLDLPVFVLKPPSDNQLVAAPIDTVAVWDTVGALGIPAYNVRFVRIDVFEFANAVLGPSVQRGLQAVAVDERRDDFTPTLWDGDARITQVLFPGAHADVGGGYPAGGNESGLSDCTLKWMTGELAKRGVRFSTAPVFAPKPDSKGVAHQPWVHPPWDALPRGNRSFPGGLCLSQCLLDRMNGGMVCCDPGAGGIAYVPANIGTYVAGTAAAAGVVVI
jgi:uncharacterized protein (DUF2235 family)